MLQSLSTLSPPRRFGQPPDSRRTSCVSLAMVWSGHPACLASAGSQETSPCRYRIGGIGSCLSGMVGCQIGCNAITGTLGWAGAETALSYAKAHCEACECCHDCGQVCASWSFRVVQG
jgi:hypothetical protein